MRLPVRGQGVIDVVGENIRRIRIERNLSMQALADQAEIELSAVSRIETGKVNPKLATLAVIAEALGVNPKEFFGS